MLFFIYFLSAQAAIVAIAHAQRPGTSRLGTVHDRAPALQDPTTFVTTETVTTTSGIRVETCQVTLTPVSGRDGQSLVREDRNCTSYFSPKLPQSGKNTSSTSDVEPSASSDGTVDETRTGHASMTVTTSQASNTGTTTDTIFVTATSFVMATSSSVTTTARTTKASISIANTTVDPKQTSTTLTTTSNPPISVIGTTLVMKSNTISLAAVSATPSGVENTLSVTSSLPAASSTLSSSRIAAAVATIPVGPISSAADPSPTTVTPEAVSSSTQASQAAVVAANISSSSVQLPGTKLSVLPIGLAILGGILAIALAIVGYMMWERRKYRRTFRERRRLAEQVTGRGYGGMAERV